MPGSWNKYERHLVSITEIFHDTDDKYLRDQLVFSLLYKCSIRVPGQQGGYRCNGAQQVEERVLQQPLHGPIGVGGGVAGGTGGVVQQSHSEE